MPVRLDRIDLAILRILQREGRVTNAALAQRVGLTASPCLQRVRRLERAGIVTGYGARLDLARIGESLTVFTEITLDRHGPGDFTRFERFVGALEAVVECHLVSGGYDYLLKVVTPNLNAYQATIERILTECGGIAQYFSTVTIRSPLENRPPPLPKTE